MVELIVGLGNPGKQYDNTRHNIGFMALDRYAEMAKVSWKDGFKGQYAIISDRALHYYLLKPMTYMNLSGESVGAFCRYYKLNIANTIVVHDELDYEFGKVKLRVGGSAAGHNGIKSIIQHMGTQEFPRVRMGIAGISRAEIRGHTADYVLAPFTKVEQEQLPAMLDNAVNAIRCAVEKGFAKAMLEFNKG